MGPISVRWGVKEWLAVLTLFASLVYGYADLKFSLGGIATEQQRQGKSQGQVVRYLSSRDPQFWQTVNQQGGETP